MRRTLLIVLAVLVPTGAIGIGLAKRLMTPPASAAAAVASDDPGAGSSGAGVTLRFSDKPVDVPAFELTDLDGRKITPADWKGKVVLVNFWATWCGPCRAEIPALIALQEHYRKQVLVVGLSIDEKPPADVKAFVANANINYPVAIAPPDLASKFGDVSAIPVTFVVTPKGQIIQKHVGPIDPVIGEHEIRVLSNLPSQAAVETVPDNGQIVLANAAFATEIPGVDLKGLSSEKKEAVLKQMNTDKCTCGCGLTLAQCRINDPTCTTSLPIAQKIAADARRR